MAAWRASGSGHCLVSPGEVSRVASVHMHAGKRAGAGQTWRKMAKIESHAHVKVLKCGGTGCRGIGARTGERIGIELERKGESVLAEAGKSLTEEIAGLALCGQYGSED